MISLVLLVLAALCFLLAAIGRPAWPWLPIGLFLLTLAFLFGGMGGLEISAD